MGMLDPANDFRFLQETETQENRIISEGLVSQFRKNIEESVMYTRRTGVTGTTTSIPTDTLITDTGASFSSGGLVGRQLVVTSGAASGYSSIITSNTGTTITCATGNFLSSGMASGDSFTVLYTFNVKGHSHNGVDSVAVGAPVLIHSKTSAGVTAMGTSIGTGWGNWDSNTYLYVKRPGVTKIFGSAYGTCSSIILSVNLQVAPVVYWSFRFSAGFASTEVMELTSPYAKDISAQSDYSVTPFSPIYLGDYNGAAAGTVYGLELFTG
jgi:hypothetical protein